MYKLKASLFIHLLPEGYVCLLYLLHDNVLIYFEVIDHQIYISWQCFRVAHCDDLRLSRPEAATVGCCRRQWHLWSHRNPYSRPEAAIFSCGRRPQDFLKHMSRQKSGRMVTIVKQIKATFLKSYRSYL